jgi:hypothetical protein
MVDDLASYFFEGNCFMDRCLKFGHMIEVVTTSYKEVCKDMQKMSEQSKITKSSVCPLSFTLHYLITLTAYNLGQ